jgi:uncharacterized membrane protein YqjE
VAPVVPVFLEDNRWLSREKTNRQRRLLHLALLASIWAIRRSRKCEHIPIPALCTALILHPSCPTRGRF